jgi:hypothetical protein
MINRFTGKIIVANHHKNDYAPNSHKPIPSIFLKAPLSIIALALTCHFILALTLDICPSPRRKSFGCYRVEFKNIAVTIVLRAGTEN